MSDTRARREDLVVLGILVLLLSVVYLDVLFLGNGVFTRDLTIYHYPMKKVVRDTILRGDLPFWNPAFAGGQPMAANPAYEVFYPPQWLTLIPDYNLGFRLHIMLHVYLAAIGAFLFLRSRGVRRSIAFVGGAAMVMGGPFVSVLNLLPFMFSIAWAPWIALCGSRYFDTRARRDLALLVVFLGLQAIVCEPTTLLQTWFLLGLWGAWRGWSGATGRRAREAMKGFLTSVMIVIAGLVLSAVQFLPALDHAADSVRRSGFRWETVSQWSFPPLRFVEFVFPSFLGLIETGGPQYWGARLYANVSGPYLYSVYIGLPFVALALAGLVARKRGSAFVLVALFVSGVLAMGSWTPVFRLLYDSSLLPSIRYPEKFILMGAFVSLAWGCLVLEDLLGGDRRIAALTTWILVAAAVVAAGVFVWSFSAHYLTWFVSFWDGASEHAARVARVHWLIAVARGLAFAAVLEMARRTRTRAAVALLVLIVVADLGPLANQVNPRMPRRFFEPPPIAERAAEAAAGRRLLHLGWLERDTGLLRSMARGLDAYWVLRNGLVPHTPAVAGIPTILEWDVDETQLAHTREFFDYAIRYMKPEGSGSWSREPVRQIAGMCNVGLMAWFKADAHLARDIENVDAVELGAVRGGSRYYFATEAVAVDGIGEMFGRLVAQRWPQEVAFVDARTPTSTGFVHSVRETASVIDLDVEALGDALLVASVTRHKYWSATLDGVSVALQPVNHAFQGVVVPPGRHDVKMRYFNPFVAAGLASSLTMLMGLIAGVWRKRIR